MILTIDIGTTMGWCLFDDTTSISGSKSFKGERHEGAGMRYLRFKAWLIETHAKTPLKAVFYEDVQAHSSHYAGQAYGAFRSQLLVFCEENNIPYQGIPVQTIKKFATGKGNAKKSLMVLAARKHGFEPVDDNEADAICIALYVRDNPIAQALA